MKTLSLSLIVLLGTLSCLWGQTTFTESTSSTFVEVREGSIAFADIDGDQDQDVLVTGRDAGSDGITVLYQNNGLGVFTEVTGTPFPGVSLSSVAFADVDGDQDQDLMITGKKTGSPLVLIADLFTNDGLGNFTKVAGTTFPKVMSSAIAFADVDNDQDPDLLITGDVVGMSKVAKLYLNDGLGQFTEVMNTPFEGVDNGAVAFADVDNDQDQDLMITGEGETTGRSARLFLNDGQGNYTQVPATPFAKVVNSSIAFADIDNDDDPDVLITGAGVSMARLANLYQNDGQGNFTEMPGTPFEGVDNGEVAFGDVDRDNDLDLFITGNGAIAGRIAELYLNDGTGSFSLLSGLPFAGVDNAALGIADVDGDQDIDVLISGETTGSSYSTRLYFNDLILGAITPTLQYAVKIFPNPTTDLVYISLEPMPREVQVRLVNEVGQVLLDKTYRSTPQIEWRIEGPQGLYWFILRDEKGHQQSFPVLRH